MWHVSIYCVSRKGSERRECVIDWPIAEILGTTLEQALFEARKVCSFDECDLDIQIRNQP